MRSDTEAERIADGLSAEDAFVVHAKGIAYRRAPFLAPVMRPLERRGIFCRIERKGFQTRWELTDLGLRVRAVLEAREAGK